MDKQIATVLINGREAAAAVGQKLSEFTKHTDHPCAGRGNCGKCKVLASGALSPVSETEKAHLTAAELARGVRLACCTHILGNCRVEEFAAGGSASVLLSSAPLAAQESTLVGYGVAIDIGTTTLAAKLFDKNGNELASHGMLNPQGVWGADVISRIEAAMGGKRDEIALAVQKALSQMIVSLAEAGGIQSTEITSAVITGNTAMLYLLTRTDTAPLSRAPFGAPRLFGETLAPEALGILRLSPEAKVYIPRCISAFVGADTVCALLASGIAEQSAPALLADIGTNGEIALWNGGRLTVASTAAGPAFEGALISCGMRGEKGAVDRVTYENGKFAVHVIGDTAPRGICGSGLVDAVAALLECGMLDESGYLEVGEAVIAPPASVTQQDIRMVQLAKSAISAGISTLMNAEGLTAAEIGNLFLAGGFGSYLNVDSAGKIGLIPQNLCKKVQVLGNAALAGASMLLLNPALREKASALARMASTYNLAESTVFAEEYVAGMMFE